MKLSVALITLNEEANLSRTLQSVMPLVHDGDSEIIIVDSGSSDRTLEIAHSYSARVFVEPWKGFAAQKNSAMDKGTGDWILQLDADESLEPGLAGEIHALIWGTPPQGPTGDVLQWDALTSGSQANGSPNSVGFWIPRKNYFLGRWIKHGGFYPDPKLRLIRRGAGKFEEYGAHPTIRVDGPTGKLTHALVHCAYPTLQGYIAHMNSYSSAGAQIASGRGHSRFSLINIVLRPGLTFLYNYVFRLGFLDGREGLLLHLYHAGYVSWKYAKAWELARRQPS
ncbi:MAG: glycosyltransferase family 2 protein [Acidobacteria bacterium]|nr:glycosyltransferase family 2 protein [Acidobacteriota bacterium]